MHFPRMRTGSLAGLLFPLFCCRETSTPDVLRPGFVWMQGSMFARPRPSIIMSTPPVFCCPLFFVYLCDPHVENLRLLFYFSLYFLFLCLFPFYFSRFFLIFIFLLPPRFLFQVAKSSKIRTSTLCLF